MKYIDLKDKELSELKELLAKNKFELVGLRQKLKLSHLANPNLIKQKRRDIARISTAVTAKTKGN